MSGFTCIMNTRWSVTYDTPIHIEFTEEQHEYELNIGRVLLSKTEQELALICAI